MPKIHFDVTRLFVRGSRFSPTGIDRVVLAYAEWLLARPDVTLEPVLTVGGRLLSLKRSVLADLIEGQQLFSREASARADPLWARLEGMLAATDDPIEPLRAPRLTRQIPARARWYVDVAARSLRQLRPTRVGRGSYYLNVSHTGLGDPAVLRRVAAAGARPVVMVHDLIPIHHPEYCSPQAEERHVRRMRQIVDHAAHVITNSQTTAREFGDYAVGTGRSPPPTTAIPLGLQHAFLGQPGPVVAARPYFVCVGTIEARKNLAFLLALWRRLEERLGPSAPRLVIVGRRGWENEAVIDHLDRSKAVMRLVHEVCDVHDADLARLMANAAALLSPSLAEGYDLPVLEALALRTPVIASEIPVHAELAIGATLLDPLDGPAWLSAIAAAAARRSCGPAFAAPTWEGHFRSAAPILGLEAEAIGGPPLPH
jgi:glycosyltransferase involved in cell wall biosynthesis